MTDASTLGSFEGTPVVGTGIEIPSAAGGLRDALKIDPQVLHKGQRVMVLLDCEVGKIRHDPVKDSDEWNRVHILATNGATIVDGDVFDEALAAQADRIARAKDAESGQQRTDDAMELAAAHDKGEHADGLVEGCPQCDAEVDALASETGDAA